MYVITVTLDAVPGRAKLLEDALLAQSETSLCEEPACLRFDVARDPEND